MGSSLRGIAQSGRQMGLSLRGIAQLAMKVNAWVCALANDSEWFDCATDRDLQSVLSKSVSVRTRKLVNHA